MNILGPDILRKSLRIPHPSVKLNISGISALTSTKFLLKILKKLVGTDSISNISKRKDVSKKGGQWGSHSKQWSHLISGIQSDGTLRNQLLLPFHGSQEWPHQAVLDGRDLGRTWCSHHRYSAWHIGWAACFRQNLGRGGWRCFQQTSQHGFQDPEMWKIYSRSTISTKKSVTSPPHPLQSK